MPELKTYQEYLATKKYSPSEAIIRMLCDQFRERGDHDETLIVSPDDYADLYLERQAKGLFLSESTTTDRNSICVIGPCHVLRVQIGNI